MSKCAASFAIPFSWLSSHYENSKSTSGYICELKQILVDFLRAFRGVASHTSPLQRKGGCSTRGGGESSLPMICTIHALLQLRVACIR